MQIRLLLFILLIAWLTLASPVSIFSWLAGAHVTIEQQLVHQHAVAVHGTHVHAGESLADEGNSDLDLSADIGLHSLRATQAGGDGGLLTAWVALLLAVVLMAPLAMRRLRQIKAIVLPSRGPEVLRRPPQLPPAI
jgi:hypothetical protein